MHLDHELMTLLAKKLQTKWRAENKLPRTIDVFTLHGPVPIRFYSIIFSNWLGKGFAFRYTDVGNFMAEPEISLKEVLQELWNTLSDKEKAEVSAEILGKRD